MAEITKKYLDLGGLTKYDGLIKAWVNNRITAEAYDDSELQGKVGALETLTADYATVKSNAANSVAAWTKFLAGSFTTEVTPTLAQLATQDYVDGRFLNEVTGKFDTVGSAAAALEDAKEYTDEREVEIDKKWAAADATLKTELQGYADQAEADALDAAKDYVDGRFLDEVTGKFDTVGSAEAAETAAKAYTDEREIEIDKKWAAADATLKTELQGYADQAEADAKSYVDGRFLDEVTGKFDTVGSAEAAETAAKAYTDEREVAINGKISSIEAAIQGGTHFIGVLEKLPETVNAGDIFVAKSSFGNFKKDLEYIYDGTNWYELGDSSANAQAIANLESNKADKATTYTKDEVNSIKSGLETYADDAEAAAIAAAKKYTDDREIEIDKKWAAADATLKTELQGYADQAEADALSAAKKYTDDREIEIDKKWAAADAVVDAAAQGYAGAAETAAKKHADDLFASIGSIDEGDISGLFD